MKNNKIIGKIIDYALNVFIVIFAIFLLITMYTAFQVKILKNEYSNFFGYTLFEVQTGSMHKTIEAGDWIIVKSTKDVEIGDIVTYKHNNEFITHRIIESYKGTYVTKGDANTAKDDPIDQSQIVGKVVKTLHGFGILRKTIFNPTVIIILIITLYLFNLTFKTGKSKFDLKVEEIIKKLKKIIIKKMKKNNSQEIKSEKVKITIENPTELIKENKEEQKENIIEQEKNIEQKISPIITVFKEKQENKEQEEQKEENLSKTAMFRMISIQPDEKIEEKRENKEQEEDLSKTAMFRVIKADSKDVDKKENQTIEKNKEQFTEVVNLKLNAEEIEIPVAEKKITKEYIKEKIKSKKSKNIIEKAFFIKKIIYDEILDVLLRKEKAYINKSNMRKYFIEEYMNLKYFSFDEDRENIKKRLETLGKELTKQFIRDEKKVNTIDAYIKSLLLISTIEEKENINLEKELKKVYTYDDETIENMAYDIQNILNYSDEYLKEILEKLDTKTFEVKYNKIIDNKNLYGVVLNHNISFSKVYSEYIVDKTYKEGIVSEDKIAVLLNLLLCRIVSDIMEKKYEKKYIIYAPNALYGKDKKLDKILSTIDNEYAKNHIYILSSVTNALKNKEDIKRLRKKGYLFAMAFNKELELKDDDMGYIYMADYYFIDSTENSAAICETIPTELIKRVIKDNISNKVGDFRGD